jgi:hypothetical protein
MIYCPVALGSNLLNCNKNWLHSYYKEEATHSCIGFFFTPQNGVHDHLSAFQNTLPTHFFSSPNIFSELLTPLPLFSLQGTKSEIENTE